MDWSLQVATEAENEASSEAKALSGLPTSEPHSFAKESELFLLNVVFIYLDSFRDENIALGLYRGIYKTHRCHVRKMRGL